MQKQQVESNDIFLNYFGTTFGKSVKASLLAGALIVAEVNKCVMPKFKTPEEKKSHLSGLELQDPGIYEQTKEDFFKFSYVIRKDVSTICSILCSFCHLSICNHVEVDPEYQAMEKNSRFDTIKMCQSFRENYSGSVGVLVDNVIVSLMKG